MNAVRIINRLVHMDVILFEEEGKLKFRAPKGVMTPEIKAMIISHQEEILGCLAPRQGEPVNALLGDAEARYRPFPLTRIQRAYYVGRTDVFDFGNLPCHLYMEYEIRQENAKNMNLAVNRLIRRHEMLRAMFRPDGTQMIRKNVPLYRIPVQPTEGMAIENRIQEIRQKMSQKVMDLEAWPLFEIRALDLGKGKMYLFFGIDMMIADATAVQTLFREFSILRRDPEVVLPPLKVSFRDYVLATSPDPESPGYRNARRYWLRRLPSLPPAAILPRKEGRSGGASAFRRLETLFDFRITAALKGLAGDGGVTFTSLVLTAFADILSLWVGTRHFLINLTLFNREFVHPQVMDIVGDFTSVNLLEVNLEDDVLKSAARIQKQLIRDLDHQAFSGVDLIQKIAETQGANAMVPVVFTGNLGRDFKGEQNPDCRQVYSITRTPQVWLDCQALEIGNRLQIFWDFPEDLFPPGMIKDMFQAFLEYVERLGHGMPDRPSLPRDSALHRENIHDTAFPESGKLLHNLVADSSDTHTPAVISGDTSLTYAQLHQRAMTVACSICRNTTESDAPVAVLLPKGLEQVVAVLGILNAQRPYLPLDTDMPARRLDYILDLCEVRAVITQKELWQNLDLTSDPVPLFIEDLPASYPEDEHPPREGQSPDDTAYIIFTSGSTGKPKGVVISHRSAVNTILDINRRFKVGPGDRVLGISALGFDLSVYDIFGILAAGGTLVIPEAFRYKDPSHLLQLMRDLGITIWNSVPMFMQMLIAHLEGERVYAPVSLRYVLLSGDWILPDLPDRIKSHFPGVQVISLGGATEASIWSIFYPVEEKHSLCSTIPYGKPLSNQRVYVLNPDMTECPAWVTGSLFIGGTGLAKAYFKDAQKTRSAFVTHPETGERLYRTGDMGRYLPDGNIEFLGREDFQIKIRGFRVEPGEVEYALKGHSKVRDALICRTGETLGAYVIWKGDGTEPKAELQEHLAARLPDYMIPRHICLLDRFPLNTNGKVDRKRLPAFNRDTAALPESGVIDSQIVTRLTILIREISGVPTVRPLDNFFDLGINSLHLIELKNALQEHLGVKVPVMTMFEHTCIQALGEYIARATSQNSRIRQAHQKAWRRAQAAKNRQHHRTRKLKEPVE